MTEYVATDSGQRCDGKHEGYYMPSTNTHSDSSAEDESEDESTDNETVTPDPENPNSGNPNGNNGSGNGNNGSESGTGNETEMAKTTVVEKPPHLIRGMALSRQRNSIPGFQKSIFYTRTKKKTEMILLILTFSSVFFLLSFRI